MATHRATVATRQGLRPVLVFFALAFVLTWVWWIPAVMIERGSLPLDLPWIVLMIPGGLGPLLAALICSGTAFGGPGVRPFLRHAFQWRSTPGFYVLATFGMAAMVLGTVPVHLIAGATWDSSGALAGLIAVVPMFVFTFVLGGGVDEEFGWRGYALPRLQAELPPWSANLLLGVAWSLWHLPLWWNPAVAQSNLNFPLYLLSTTGFSLVLGWLYNASGGNVMVIVTAHTCSNLAYGLQSAAIDPVYQWINVAVMAGSGLLVLVLTRGRIGHRRPATPLPNDAGIGM